MSGSVLYFNFFLFLFLGSAQAIQKKEQPVLVLNPNLTAKFSLDGFRAYSWDGFGGAAWVNPPTQEEVRVFGLAQQSKPIEANQEWAIYLKTQGYLGHKVTNLGCHLDLNKDQNCFSLVVEKTGDSSVHRMWFSPNSIAALVIAKSPKGQNRGRALASAAMLTSTILKRTKDKSSK